VAELHCYQLCLQGLPTLEYTLDSQVLASPRWGYRVHNDLKMSRKLSSSLGT
jgi:hypothetical protein